MDERIEAYVDGDLPADEQARFERALQTAPRWRAHVEQARIIRDGLHTLPRLACPPSVAEAVQATVQQRQTDRAERAPQRRLRLRPSAVWTSAVAAALLLVIAFAALRHPSVPSDTETRPFTEAEVEQATAEIAWTLAYLAQLGEETGRAVEDVLPNAELVRSTRQALQPVLGKPSDADNFSK